MNTKTIYVTGAFVNGDFRAAKSFARQQSAEARSDEAVYLRSTFLDRDVMVARYVGGRPVQIGDTPRDVVLTYIRARRAQSATV